MDECGYEYGWMKIWMSKYEWVNMNMNGYEWIWIRKMIIINE